MKLKLLTGGGECVLTTLLLPIAPNGVGGDFSSSEVHYGEDTVVCRGCYRLPERPFDCL